MTVSDTFTIDGINDVVYKYGDGSTTGTQSFFSGFLGYLSQWISGGDDLNSTVTLTGSDWTVATLRFGAEGGNHVTITDADSADGRRIDYLKLGSSSDVTLNSTRVKYIEGHEGGNHSVVLGMSQTQSTKSINLYGDMNEVTTGSAYVGTIETDNDSIIVVNSDVGSIFTKNDDVLTVNDGFVELAKIRGGQDEVTVAGGATIETLKSNGDGGSANVTVQDGGEIKYYKVNGVDLTVNMDGDGRIRKTSTFEGSNDITTGNRWVDSIDTWDTVNTSIHIGSGGIGSLTMGSEDMGLSHTVTADGWVGFLAVWQSDSIDLTLGNGGGSMIQLSVGDDKVTTGNGYVEAVLTGEGDDVVKIGAGGIGTLSTWIGDDTIKAAMLPGQTQFVNAGDGKDTLDFSKFTKKVEFSLEGDYVVQHIHDDAGSYAETGVENLTGGKKNDTLTGDDGKNKLVGKNGDDTLAGGKGKDKLQGDKGSDVFVFGKKGGTDTVLDFKQGQDLLRIEDHSGGFGTLTISNDSGDRKIVYDGGTILLDDLKGLSLTAADFEFV